MGKARVKEGEDGSERSPPKTKAGEPVSVPSTSGAGQAHGEDQQSSGMLGALLSISNILQKGFNTLETKVGEVSVNMNKMDDNLNKRFDDMLVQSEEDEESQSEEQQDPIVVPKKGKRKRQTEHELSEGEVEEFASPVLCEASKVIEQDDSVSLPIKEEVASFVKKAFAKPVKYDAVKKINESMRIPENVECLKVPRLNSPIYVKVPTDVKNRVRASQDNQAMFMKVVSALVKITDTLCKHEQEGQWVKDTMKLSADAITVSAYLQKSWLKARREDIKTFLPEDFKRLSAEEVPLDAKNLFGDDLEGSIKSLESTNKISQKMEPKKPKPQNQQKNSSKNHYKKRRTTTTKKTTRIRLQRRTIVTKRIFRRRDRRTRTGKRSP